MEARGISTNKGCLNKWIRKTNALIRRLVKRIADLKVWVSDKHDIILPQRPDDLHTLITEYYDDRRLVSLRRGYHKISQHDLQEKTDILNFLMSSNLHSAEDLENRIDTISSAVSALKKKLKSLDKKSKDLSKLADMAEIYLRTRPTYDAYCGIRFNKRRENFKAEHETELRQFYMARRRLSETLGENFICTTQTLKEMQDGIAQLQCERYDISDELSPLQEQEQTLSNLRWKVDRALTLQSETQEEKQQRMSIEEEKGRAQ